MLRLALTGACRVLLSSFFRRIEVVGRHHLPQTGSLLFAMNHPNGLVDPLFILCLSQRRVSFLAKEPLFRTPIISIFVKAFESLPVYRSQDGADPEQNRKMMKDAADLLARGNALSIFPEGTSHSEPSLKRFRSGGARIALSARALGENEVNIVPVALYYERKQTFRSRAVLAFGPPLPVPLVQLDAAGESPREEGQKLTNQLQHEVEKLMPTAETAEELVLAELAERILATASRELPTVCPTAVEIVNNIAHGARTTPQKKPSLARRMATRHKIIDAYRKSVELHPEATGRVVEQVKVLRARVELAGLSIDASPPRSSAIVSRCTSRLVRYLALAPLALPGILLHIPAYYLVRALSFRFSGNETDVVATIKILGGMLFFPLTWLAYAGFLAWFVGSPALLLLALTGPVLAWIALQFLELSASLSRSQVTLKDGLNAGFNWQELQQQRAQLAEDIAILLR